MNKEKIIKNNETYSEIISTGKSIKNKYFSVYFKKSDNDNKYGITIPKKVGKAIVRNKLKRQTKNIIITNEINIQKKYNYVIIVKEATLSLSYNDMVNELLDLFKKVRN
jgi:ribonuclease P protein component